MTSTVEKLQTLGLKLGSVQITTKMKKGIISKFPVFNVASWKDEPKLSTNAKYNGNYFLTGENNDIVVLDLDNMEDKNCIEMKNLADKCASVVVKTRKGFHYYFKFDPDFSETLHGKKAFNVDFDLQSNGALVFCPPTTYKHCETQEVFKYELIKYSKELISMSKELKNKIMSIIGKEKPTKKAPKTLPSEVPTKSESKVTIDDDLYYKLINGLNKVRSLDYKQWQDAGYCFHNSDMDLKYFDYFSKKYYEEYDKDEVEHFYKKLKVRSDEDRKLTMSTIWQWLHEDNEKLFFELRKEAQKEFFIIEFGKYEVFSYVKLLELIKKDEDDLKDEYYYLFNASRSFQYFNHFHVYHLYQASVYRIGESTPILYQKAELPNASVKQYIKGAKKTVIKEHSFITMWEREKSIRIIEKFIFNPDPNYKCPDSVINLFNGFEIDNLDNDGTYDMNAISPFFEHIKTLMNDEEKEVNFLLNWMAFIIQKPHKKTCSAIVLYGNTQGDGKNLTLDIFGALLGKYYLHINNLVEASNIFNSQQQNKLFITCDELNARARDLADELKNIITRNKQTITYKGKESFEIEDYCNWGFTTNNEGVLRVPIGERRFQIYEGCEAKISKERIKQLVNILESKDLLRQLFNFFKARDISNFNPREVILTKYKKELMLNDLPAYITMFRTHANQYNDVKLTPKNIFLQGVQYAKENKMTYSFTELRCFKDIKKFFGQFQSKTKNNNKTYDFPEDFSDKVDDIIRNVIEKSDS